MRRRLLCTDLDRTLIPNGTQPESPKAPELFSRLVTRKELTLVYVTGRNRALIEEAIQEFELPYPAYAIADVGSSIYQIINNAWILLPEWQALLQECWPESQLAQLKHGLADFPALRLQEHNKQGRFKVSFYADIAQDFDRLQSDVAELVVQNGLPVNLIWSRDEQTGNGLLDVLPKPANKLTAVCYVKDRLGFSLDDTLFAGDSGNDLCVFSSLIPSVIVANADEEIKQAALRHCSGTTYIAKGNHAGLNGNYRAGIVEGVCHFWPEAVKWIQEN